MGVFDGVKGLGPKQAQTLERNLEKAGGISVREYGKREVVLRRGEDPEGIGILQSGILLLESVNLDGQLLTVAEALERADYGKVYIMLGLNELGWVYESVFAEDYWKIIDVIRSSHPEAEIYVQSIMPVSRLKDGDGGVYTNANVVRLQKALCEMCLEKGVHYVNVAEAVQDAEGFLPDASTPDGVHLTPECCGLWADYLKTHTGV